MFTKCLYKQKLRFFDEGLFELNFEGQDQVTADLNLLLVICGDFSSVSTVNELFAISTLQCTGITRFSFLDDVRDWT